jgi:hypothetical protein
MINAKQHPVGWAGLLTELDDAREHLQSLLDKMQKDGTIEASELAVELGHVYAHLNRAWHSRNQETEITEDQWPAFSAFPKDVEPVG